MPWGLKRFYGTGGLHFITWSCYRRLPLLASPARRDLFLTVLERMRERYRFAAIGYVVMPEHVHLCWFPSHRLPIPRQWCRR